METTPLLEDERRNKKLKEEQDAKMEIENGTGVTYGSPSAEAQTREASPPLLEEANEARGAFLQPLFCPANRATSWPLGLKWHPRNIMGFCTRQMLATAFYGVICLYWNCVIQVYAQTRAEVFKTIPEKYNMTEADEECKG